MKILANGQEFEVGENRFTVLVHQQGIRVDVPEAVEINSRNTIDCIEKMNQRQWEHISSGQLFRILFSAIFPQEDYKEGGRDFPAPTHRVEIEGQEPMILHVEPGIPIPATIEELKRGDFGMQHAAGMIILGCEAIFEGKLKLYFRTPEDHLHPKAERRITEMFRQMMYLAGATGVVEEEKGTVADAVRGVLPDPVPEPSPEPEKKPKPKKKESPRKKPPRKKKNDDK